MRTDDEELYLVYWYEEVDLLTNVLRALAHYRRVLGPLWPRVITLRDGNRLPFHKFGEDTELMRVDKSLVVDAMYMSMYAPYPDQPVKRTPTVFICEREPLEDAGAIIFRSRRYGRFV